MKLGCFGAFIGVFYLIGFALTGFGLWSAWQSVRAARWPTTPVRLVKLDLETDSSGENPTHLVKVEYEYAVGGTTYTGSRIAFGYAGSGSLAAHSRLHDKLKGARSISVRYNPADPAVSCLSFGWHQSIQAILAFGLFWLVFTVGFTVLIWVMSRADDVLLNNLSVQ